MKLVMCVKCNKLAKTDTTKIPHVIGTSVAMHCSDCDGMEHPADMPRYQGGPATMCRECCPTGHGTKTVWDMEKR